jgi:hypothetical protein
MTKATAVNTMSKTAGVWIDHRRAHIVGLTPDGDQSTTVLSNVEKHLARGGDSPMKGSYEAQQVPADDRKQRALTGELNRYYDSVIDKLRGYGQLLILGPGEAKGEFKARLLQAHLGERIAAVLTEGKMSDRQLVAKVKEYFGAAARVQ